MNSATSIMLRAGGFAGPSLGLEVAKKLFYLCSIFIGFMFGMSGFLISLIFSGVVSVILNILVTNKFLKTKFFDHVKNLIIPYFISATSVVIVYFFSSLITGHLLSFILTTFLFFSLYLILHYVFKTSAFLTLMVLCKKELFIRSK
jgi:hypothetical protein